MSFWSDGNDENMNELGDQHGITYPMIAGRLGQFEKNGGIPTYVLVGPGHELLMVDEGRPTNEQIQAAIDGTFGDAE